MNNSNNFYEKEGRIQIIAEQKLRKLIEGYYFYEFSTEFDICQSQILFQNIAKSEIAIINKYEINTKTVFFIISFHNTVIVIKKSLVHLLAPLFSCKTQLKLYFSQSAKNIFNQEMRNTNYFNEIQIECDDSIDEEIDNFNIHMLNFKITDFEYHKMYSYIKTSISRYLIQESYNRLNKEQIVDFSKDFIIKPPEDKLMKIEIWDENEYIELKGIGKGSSSNVKLVFQIENKKIYAIKMQGDIENEKEDYCTREYRNYLQLDYPLLPKLYGIYEYDDRYYLKIQYINGQTLSNIAKSGQLQSLTINDKIFIILQLMLIINYFHEKGFVYRDLKPDNVIVVENKTVFIIDFDRLITEKADILKEEEHTKDFSHEYVAPEVNKGIITRKSDIYSLGKIIRLILNKESLNYDFKSFFDENPNNRPSIFDILFNFNLFFSSQINDLLIKYTPRIQYFQGLINIENDIKSAIHHFTLAANQNHPQAQFKLGLIYYEGHYITRDINKSIHYLTLAANQNDLQAQYILGLIYYEGQYITRDIHKSIHYFTLAANQNHLNAQFKLGLIYAEGEYITRDINRSIHYFTLAANQNDPQAQFNLGLIYSDGKYITQDINKSIHYYTLAANQNDPQAQFNLGLIYSDGKYITRDINRSIHYFTLAANQNITQAQFDLGLIYSDGKYITRDINKSIHYYALSANQNHPQAQFNLGLIYYEGQYITRDINRSIHYFTLAANQNDPQAQYILGLIYSDGKYITRDINESIHYYTLAANQNYLNAQYNLGFIYYSGEYITRDINKSIHFYTLAANQNHRQAQFKLGFIYYSGEYITRDINKSIHYFTLAANQNILQAQFNLGLIYYSGEYITRDINKSIHYFTLAANQNHPQAQFKLGLIYYEGQYITRDINKSINYYKLSANQNDSHAQFNLGLIYYEGQYITRDINKSIHYFKLAANNHHPQAQYNLGLIYYEGRYITRDINKSIHYLTLATNQNDPQAQCFLGILNLIKNNTNRALNLLDKSSSAGNIRANFTIGYLYHEGKYLDRNMSKCIKHYKYASSFNDIYSKNNLGVIYKNGIGDEIPKNIGYAIEYFEETVRRWEDKLSMYNLSHIYIYEIKTEGKINESIEMLIKSSNQNFEPSKYLLIIALIKKNKFDLEKIRNELTKKSNNLSMQINKLILKLKLFDESIFQQFEKKFETIDYLYCISYNYIQSKYMLNQKNERKNNKVKIISQKFYDGFGNDI